MTVPWEAHHTHIEALIQTALTAANPAAAVRRILQGESPPHTFQYGTIQAEPLIDPQTFKTIWLVGGGKASIGMAQAAIEEVGERIAGGALCVPLGMADTSLAPLTVYPAAHPIPDERNLKGAAAIAEIARNAGDDDLVLCLLSGGGSAHLTLPMEGIPLGDMQAVTQALLLKGASIEDLNIFRKHCEQLKGGRLARLAAPAHVWSLILSDVIGDRLEIIASGPTSPDSTVIYEALAIMDDYGVRDVSPTITAYLEASRQVEAAQTVKSLDPIFDKVKNTIVWANYETATATTEFARQMGFAAETVDVVLEGEARDAARLLVYALAQNDTLDRPQVFIMGGETTVTVQGKGSGGRNQELALAAAIEIDGMQQVAIATFATDGIDGPTPAAGAIVTGQTYKQARDMGLDPQTYLDNNDSHTFFEKLDGHIITGPTGTNVNDLAFVLVY